MLSCTSLNVVLFIRGVSNDSSRTDHKRRLCNLPCGNFTRTRSALQEDCAFQRHSTIANLLHTIHIAALTLDSCRFMICMRFARCVHSRTDVQPYHKHRVEGPHHARTASVTTVPHRSRHPVLETPCSA